VLDDRAVRVGGTGPFIVEGRTITRDPANGAWLVDGEPAIAVRDGNDVWVKWRGETYVLDSAGRQRNVGALAATEIAAPMPGVILEVHATAGQAVRQGDLVCVVEAMKMELRVEAPAEGTVTKVLCSVGDRVRRGQRLAEFEPAP